jgi:hypothetical protein
VEPWWLEIHMALLIEPPTVVWANLLGIRTCKVRVMVLSWMLSEGV